LEGRDLSLRVAYTIFAQGRGKELEDYKNLTQLLPMGFGDAWLRFNGIGENVAWACTTTTSRRRRLASSSPRSANGRVAAPVAQHPLAQRQLVGLVLDTFERVERRVPDPRPALDPRTPRGRVRGDLEAD